jgi:superfamily I DNA/RNA helicase
VLFRAGRDSFDLEGELKAEQIPFVKYGGIRFVELAHIKDVMSHLAGGGQSSGLRLLAAAFDAGQRHGHQDRPEASSAAWSWPAAPQATSPG